MDKIDEVFKIRLFGQHGVGKSCLLLRYTDDIYTDERIVTI